MEKEKDIKEEKRSPTASEDDIVKLFYKDHMTRTSLTETRRFWNSGPLIYLWIRIRWI